MTPPMIIAPALTQPTTVPTVRDSSSDITQSILVAKKGLKKKGPIYYMVRCWYPAGVRWTVKCRGEMSGEMSLNDISDQVWVDGRAKTIRAKKGQTIIVARVFFALFKH